MIRTLEAQGASSTAIMACTLDWPLIAVRFPAAPLDILNSCQSKLVRRLSCCGDTAPRGGGHHLLGPAHPSTMAALAAPCTAGSISFSRSVSSTQSLTAPVTLPSPYGFAILGWCQHCRDYSGGLA